MAKREQPPLVPPTRIAPTTTTYKDGVLDLDQCADRDFVVVIISRVLQQGRGLFPLVLEGHLGWVALFFQ
jgi:hypothetical protein